MASLAFVVTDENGTVAADILQGERGPPIFHQRACALPGFLARTNWGHMPQAVHDPESIKTIARDLITTCVQRALQTKTGLAPSLDQATGRVGDLRPETASSLFFMTTRYPRPVLRESGLRSIPETERLVKDSGRRLRDH